MKDYFKIYVYIYNINFIINYRNFIINFNDKYFINFIEDLIKSFD